MSNWHYTWRSQGHPPAWMNSDVWDSLQQYWRIPEFKKLSEQRKVARSYNKMYHTGGSKPFESQKRDLQKELNKRPAQIDIFERTHKKKSRQGIAGQGEWVSDSAKTVHVSYFITYFIYS